EIEGREDGAPPPVDLSAERKNGDLVRSLIEAGRVTACHDVSDGGIAVALADMAIAGNMGAETDIPGDAPGDIARLFGEDQARYILATDDPDAVLAAAEKAGVSARVLGRTGGQRLTVGDTIAISVSELRSLHENWLPDYMAGP
ncbi:MAG: AIR synthase-related protein, partial [Rhodospirillales bacterium]